MKILKENLNRFDLIQRILSAIHFFSQIPKYIPEGFSQVNIARQKPAQNLSRSRKFVQVQNLYSNTATTNCRLQPFPRGEKPPYTTKLLLVPKNISHQGSKKINHHLYLTQKNPVPLRQSDESPMKNNFWQHSPSDLTSDKNFIH